MRQLALGFGYLWRGFGLITRPGLRRFALLPLVVNGVVFAGLIVLAANQFSGLMDSLLPTLPDWLAWLTWLLWLVFALGATVIVFFTFSVVANLIGAPFNGLLAEAVERRLSDQGAPTATGGLWQALKDTPGALGDELRKLGYFALWALPLLILFWIPGLNLMAPLLWGLFSAWMLALEYGDYPMGNHGIGFASQRRVLRSRRLLTLGFGGAVALATLIPVVNFLVMPAAVAGATALWHEHLRTAAHQTLDSEAG